MNPRLDAPLPFDILVVTDRLTCAQVGRTVEEAIALILNSPLSHRVAILVRDKTVPPEVVAQTLQAVQPMTQSAGARLLVHTHVHLALAFNLDGVHLAAHDDVAIVRSQLSPQMLLGCSRHSHDPLDASDIEAADYATISPVFRPTSKPGDTREPLGMAGLQACVQRSVRPLVALGGIRPGVIAQTMAQGAAAIALCGVILQAEHPATLLEALCNELDCHRSID
ncbi:MAG TPA: thiamine phosphate synthase [Stenomitos sp.]